MSVSSFRLELISLSEFFPFVNALNYIKNFFFFRYGYDPRTSVSKLRYSYLCYYF